MRAKQVIEALHRHPDDVPPKPYLLATTTPLEELKRQFVVGAVEDKLGDPRQALAGGLVKLGVPSNKALLIGVEQGSSQAYVNRTYLKSVGLIGSVLRNAADFVRFVYELERDPDYMDDLYAEYTGAPDENYPEEE